MGNYLSCPEEYQIDYPLMYKERGLYSLFAASLVKNSQATISEMPYRRTRSKSKKKLETSSGRIDFWNWYNDTLYVIELKRVSVSPDYLVGTRKISNAWDELEEQIESAKKYNEEIEKDDSLNCIGILLVYVYNKRNSLRKIKNKSKKKINCKKVADEICSDENLNPDYIGCWIPEKKWKILAADWDMGKESKNFEANYAVFFLVTSKLSGD